MAKYVCKDCGGTNELTLGAEETVKEVGKKLADLIEKHSEHKPVDLTPVLAKLDELKRPPEQTTCEAHPELCQHKPQLQAALARVDELEHSHQVVTEEFLESQEDCPNCKPGIDSYIAKRVQKAGLVKPETLAPVVVAAATEASVSASAEDDTPPWRR